MDDVFDVKRRDLLLVSLCVQAVCFFVPSSRAENRLILEVTDRFFCEPAMPCIFL